MKPSSTRFHPEDYIQCAETGSLAVVISIIECAVEDVRRYLSPPKSCRPIAGGEVSQKAKGQARAVVTCRRIRAQQAAEFLEGEACRELVRILATCGLRVPMRRIFTELQTLKKTSR
jgi:hypothetical protein